MESNSNPVNFKNDDTAYKASLYQQISALSNKPEKWSLEEFAAFAPHQLIPEPRVNLTPEEMAEYEQLYELLYKIRDDGLKHKRPDNNTDIHEAARLCSTADQFNAYINCITHATILIDTSNSFTPPKNLCQREVLYLNEKNLLPIDLVSENKSLSGDDVNKISAQLSTLMRSTIDAIFPPHSWGKIKKDVVTNTDISELLLHPSKRTKSPFNTHLDAAEKLLQEACEIFVNPPFEHPQYTSQERKILWGKIQSMEQAIDEEKKSHPDRDVLDITGQHLKEYKIGTINHFHQLLLFLAKEKGISNVMLFTMKQAKLVDETSKEEESDEEDEEIEPFERDFFLLGIDPETSSEKSIDLIEPVWSSNQANNSKLNLLKNAVIIDPLTCSLHPFKNINGSLIENNQKLWTLRDYYIPQLNSTDHQIEEFNLDYIPVYPVCDFIPSVLYPVNMTENIFEQTKEEDEENKVQTTSVKPSLDFFTFWNSSESEESDSEEEERKKNNYKVT